MYHLRHLSVEKNVLPSQYVLLPEPGLPRTSCANGIVHEATHVLQKHRRSLVSRATHHSLDLRGMAGSSAASGPTSDAGQIILAELLGRIGALRARSVGQC
jgi:hypothetical protein